MLCKGIKGIVCGDAHTLKELYKAARGLCHTRCNPFIHLASSMLPNKEGGTRHHSTRVSPILSNCAMARQGIVESSNG